MVVIPCYLEEKLLETLESLSVIDDLDTLEVIVIINDRSLESNAHIQINEKAYKTAVAACHSKLGALNCHIVWITDIPEKFAGVGTARKIGMDEALSRFRQLRKNGIIVCLDADCRVEVNYHLAIRDFFEQNPHLDAVSIHYEHKVDPSEADADENISGIIDYELHLRLHIEWQKWLALPFAFQTVGSAMAVRSEAYAAQGGMNRRKAGEDFYFLHKFSSIDRLGELFNTTVFPSARASERVPFGTGRAIKEINEGQQQRTYDPRSYIDLLPLVKGLEKIYDGRISLQDLGMSSTVMEFFMEIEWESNLEVIRSNTTSFSAFKKRFYRYFNAFRLMKYLHHMREQVYPDVEVNTSARQLFELFDVQPPSNTALDHLLELRRRNQGR